MGESCTSVIVSRTFIRDPAGWVDPRGEFEASRAEIGKKVLEHEKDWKCLIL